jgi:RNA polymerase sigma-70 factor (ECF subfamily)
METEEGLVRQARSGDRGAFEELVRRTTRLVYARLYLETGDPHQAEDLVQETYLRAFRSIGQVDEPAGFRAWLLRIAQTVAIDSYRHGARQRRAAPPRVSQAALGDVPAPPADDPERADPRERARQVLNSLPEEYRLPLTLRYIDGADYPSIQMQLGLSAGSLRGLLYRGLQLLRKSVKFEVPHESR